MTTFTSPILKPLSLAEILDQAIRLYRNNFAKFIGILAIPYIPLIILQTAMSYLMTSSVLESASNFDPTSSPYAMFSSASYWVGALGSLVAVILQFILVQGVATAALTRAVSDNYIGKTTDIFGAYRSLGGSWFRLLLALVLAGLVGVVLLVWTILPCVGWISGPGMFVFLAWIVVPLIAPVIVLERHGAWDSVQRAWNLGRSRFWWMLGFTLILLLFGQVIITGPTLLASFLLQTFLPVSPSSLTQPLLATVLQSLVTMIFSLLYLPLQLTAITVVYFDLRIRSEGLDLALQTTGRPAEENSAVFLPEITVVPQTGLITWTEIGYFVLLTFGFVAIYVLFISLFAGAFMALSPL